MKDNFDSVAIKISIEIRPGRQIPIIEEKYFDGRSAYDIAAAIAALDYVKANLNEEYANLMKKNSGK